MAVIQKDCSPGCRLVIFHKFFMDLCNSLSEWERAEMTLKLEEKSLDSASKTEVVVLLVVHRLHGETPACTERSWRRNEDVSHLCPHFRG